MNLIINGAAYPVLDNGFAVDNIVQRIQRVLGKATAQHEEIAYELYHNLQDDLEGTEDSAGNYFELHTEDE